MTISNGWEPPLTLNQGRVEVILELCRAGIPIQLYSGGLAGASAPVTLAGATVQTVAEVIAGVTIVQTLNPGNPVRAYTLCAVMDQKYYGAVVAGPENSLMAVAGNQMMRFYHLPSKAFIFATASPVLNLQAAYEHTQGVLFAALSGADLVASGIQSIIDSNFTALYEVPIIFNEIWEMVYRIIQGVEVNSDTLAVNVIREVGPGGNYLTHRHTRQFVKKEYWRPKIGTRLRREEWERMGARDIREVAREEARKILATHRPIPLDQDVQNKLQQIVDEVEAGKI
jgi:trimethylamine--corrinoid protein Co-methyltransferase